MTTQHHPRESGEAISDEQIQDIAYRSGIVFSVPDDSDTWPSTWINSSELIKFARAVLALTPPAAPSVTAEAVARELLSALDAIKQAGSGFRGWHQKYEKAISQANQAIARAEEVLR